MTPAKPALLTERNAASGMYCVRDQATGRILGLGMSAMDALANAGRARVKK